MREHTAKLRAFWKPKGRRNKAREAILREAMKAHGSRETSITYFLYHPRFALHRRKVTKHLKGIG
jgi:hypothetical protein